MIKRSSKPIGIFDSGIGGLTVANAINKLMPNESIVYFGDTAHTPWGNQSASAIQEYSTKITNILLSYDCKAIVIACNSASAAAADIVAKIVPSHIPVFNVIDPIVEYVCNTYTNANIGVIGTKRTIHSDEYNIRIKTQNNSINVRSKITALLAPIVEETNVDEIIKKMILEKYLLTEEFLNIDALILGCTHYPLLKSLIEQIYMEHHKAIDIIDTSEIVAKTVATSLASSLQTNNEKPYHEFLVSAEHDFFNDLASNLFNQKIKFKIYS